MSQKPPPSLHPGIRVILSLIIPILAALILGLVTGSAARVSTSLGQTAIIAVAVGLASWLTGLFWYGLPGMGLRGHRALYAGIGFAALAWLAFLLVRFATVPVATYGSPGSGKTFVYLLLFEAFCLQLWSFGLFFRSVVDWRGPLAAAVASGILFGSGLFLFSRESWGTTGLGLLYFITWGVLYGVIRLRTGGLLGQVIVQAVQSWTAWQLMVPVQPVDPSALRNLYLISVILYVILIWRLWPKRVEDYRI